MTTRAIEVREFGGPEVLIPRELPDPEPEPGEAIIEVTAASVLFVDTMIRSGQARDYFPQRPPYIPGNGVAGHLADDAPIMPGRAVVARTGPHGGSHGYSERVAVPVQRLVPVPGGVDLATAAAVLHDGPTALGLLDSIGVKPAESVLIVGAAGGMALLLAQLVRSAGARVIGAARMAGAPRTAEKREAIAGAGAEVVVDYGEPDWASAVLDACGGAGPDVVFDGVGGELGRAAFEITARGGRFSAHGAPGGGLLQVSAEEAAARDVTVRGIQQVQYPPGRFEELARDALAAVAAGRLRPVIGQVYPLDRAADAHAAIAARTAIGKTLLTVA